MELPDLTHPAWQSGIGTVLGYGAILTILGLTLFLLPYLVFTAV